MCYGDIPRKAVSKARARREDLGAVAEQREELVKTREELEEAAEELIALISGGSGPYLDTGDSFFGKKNVDPCMKDAQMQTDCGGAVITRSKMTYGQADELAASVDLQDLARHIEKLHADNVNTCYWHPRPDGSVYFGEVYWAIYNYLSLRGLLGDRDPTRYDNTLESLFSLLEARMITDGHVTRDERGYCTCTTIRKN